MKKFIFKDVNKNTELVLPVTPSGFSVSTGINFETINMHSIGDLAIAGNKQLNEIKIDCFFPSKQYSFNQPNTDLNPYNYVKKFEDWCINKTLLRFVVSKTSVNRAVKIKSITYGENDGTNDVNVILTLQEVFEFKVQKKILSTGNNSRGTKKTVNSTSYVVKSGDTLSAIAQKYYGKASYYTKLAEYNKIKNPHLIYPGQNIKIFSES